MVVSFFSVFIWLIAATQVLAQTTPGPACAVTCLGDAATASGCQGVDDLTCICVVAGIFQRAADCVDQQCATTDFAAASTYLRAFCAGVSVIESATAFTLSSVPASAASSAAASGGSSAAASASAGSSAAASASGRASSAVSAISSAATSLAPSLSSAGASLSGAVSASIASASASLASASAASAAAASDASAAACPTSSSSAAEMYSRGALGWAAVVLAVTMGFGFAAVL